MRRVVALGNFDGVHLGHRVVIDAAVEQGEKRGMDVVAATFNPHPRAVLRPDSAPKLLSTMAKRRELLILAGVGEVVVIPFDRDLSNRSPEEFVRAVLVEELGAGIVVVGENFRFGYRASGNTDDLRRLMSESGGDAVAVEVRAGDHGNISSTVIREALSEGRVRDAARMLGREYSVCGPVVHGDHRGRTIGVPTANVFVDDSLQLPANGVYASRVSIGNERYGASVNIGVAPTFGEREKKVEAHILDFDRDIYGQEIEVYFVDRIRGEQKFSGVEELVGRIRLDTTVARDILSHQR